MRAERDAQFSNIFQERTTDARWVGDLGELLVNEWLRNQGVTHYRWETRDAAGNADFVVGQERVGAKTVKRQVAPRLSYTAGMTARHAHEPVDWFLFLNVSLTEKKLWLLGAIESPRFLKEATYYPAGAQVHSNYTIREGHEIFNIELCKLTPPGAWLKHLQ